MNPLEKQTKLLEALAQNLHDDAKGKYHRALYKFTYLPKFDTIKLYFEYEKDGENSNVGSSFGSANYFLAKDLRSLMKAHTGGEWSSFTLTLDANGKAHTKFYYPEDPV